MAGPTFKTGGDVWHPVPGLVAQRESDGAVAIWDGAGSWSLLSSLGGGGSGVPTGAVVFWPDASGPVPGDYAPVTGPTVLEGIPGMWIHKA